MYFVLKTEPFVCLGNGLLTIGGYVGLGISLSNIEYISIEKQHRCKPLDLPYEVDSHASVHVPFLSGVVTCGGEHESHQFAKCILQSKNNVSTEFNSMNTQRSAFAMVTNGIEVFSFGGFPYGLNNMERIDVKNESRSWVQQEMPFSVYFHCAVILDATIILSGGRDENNEVS